MSMEKILIKKLKKEKLQDQKKGIKQKCDITKKKVETKKETRVNKNRKKYRQKDIVKSNKTYQSITVLLIISLIANGLTICHFITFNHHKVKTVTKIKTKEKEVIPENIVFLGDSITYRYNLEEYYGTNHHMVNSGAEGNTTEDILNNLKERVYNYNPSKIFLLIGTNDIQKGKNTEEIIDNIKKIVEEIKINRPKAKIYIESIYPVDINNKKGMAKDRENSEIESINNKLQEYCKTEKIDFIDIYPKLLNGDKNMKAEYTKDGLHISEEGYKIITENLNGYI